MDVPGTKNLIPLTERDPEEARAIRSAGGKARWAKVKKQKTIAEMLTQILALDVTGVKVKKTLKNIGVTDTTNKMFVAVALMLQAQAGDVRAIKLLTELIGEDNQAISGDSSNLMALITGTKEEIIADDVPELQQASAFDSDVVEPSEPE